MRGDGRASPESIPQATELIIRASGFFQSAADLIFRLAGIDAWVSGVADTGSRRPVGHIPISQDDVVQDPRRIYAPERAVESVR